MIVPSLDVIMIFNKKLKKNHCTALCIITMMPNVRFGCQNETSAFPSLVSGAKARRQAMGGGIRVLYTLTKLLGPNVVAAGIAASTFCHIGDNLT